MTGQRHYDDSWRACGNQARRQWRMVALVLLAAVGLAGCGATVTSFLTRGSPFITKGTAETRNVFAVGSCPAWVDTSGAVYQLFQGENVSNADFDQVTTPGVTSRLELTMRDDLVVGCQVGTKVVVDRVLEILP
jgi:hypothetical protein